MKAQFCTENYTNIPQRQSDLAQDEPSKRNQGYRNDTRPRQQHSGHESATGARFAKDQLRSIIERIELLEEEKKAISDDIKDVYAEVKGNGNGFDVKALRTIVRLRKQDA